MKKGILIAFGEIFLKSENVKNIFLKRLIHNLDFFLNKNKIDFKIRSSRQRIFVETESSKAKRIIKNVFGIVWFSDCMYFEKTTLNSFSKYIHQNYPEWIEKNQTFAIKLKLENGIIKENKDKVIEKIASKIDRKVNLSKPNKTLFIEIRHNGWFVYFKKNKGAGGLPGSCSGKVLSLISGGIDSPVSSYLSAKRGAENIWIHFHSYPLVSNKSIEKVKEFAKIFIQYQPKIKIYFVPFQKAQIEIKAKVPANYRVLLYRRFMLKIAEKIALEEGCHALITGESLGQVSSQTLPNLEITEEAVKMPVLRPLIGMDKEEIIEIAKQISTFNISIKPQEDCCTLFVPKHQTGKGNLKKVKEYEKKLDISKLTRQIIKEAKKEKC